MTRKESISIWKNISTKGHSLMNVILPASVLNFPGPDKFIPMMKEAGFAEVKHKAFTLGICRMYVCIKRL